MKIPFFYFRNLYDDSLFLKPIAIRISAKFIWTTSATPLNIIQTTPITMITRGNCACLHTGSRDGWRMTRSTTILTTRTRAAGLPRLLGTSKLENEYFIFIFERFSVKLKHKYMNLLHDFHLLINKNVNFNHYERKKM